nr:FHA domain-containing protein [Lysinibacillus timonensis]
MNLDNSSHEKKTKPGVIIVIDCLIGVTIIFALIFTYFINSQLLLKIVISILLVILLAWLFFMKIKKRPYEEINDTKINRLVLLDYDGESLKEWYIHGIPSMLIGKSAPGAEVDIDLSDVEYASLISKEHAVLNYSSGSWFIEDLDSENGVGIKKLSDRTPQKLPSDKPTEIHFGDMIYLANTRILVK